MGVKWDMHSGAPGCAGVQHSGDFSVPDSGSSHLLLLCGNSSVNHVIIYVRQTSPGESIGVLLKSNIQFSHTNQPQSITHWLNRSAWRLSRGPGLPRSVFFFFWCHVLSCYHLLSVFANFSVFCRAAMISPIPSRLFLFSGSSGWLWIRHAVVRQKQTSQVHI